MASLLNYFLVQLVGPKCAELKVRNPEKYNFDPKWLLRKIVAIYLHFSTQEQFAAAVASDGRSYNHDVFLKTTMILQRERLVGEVDNLENIVKLCFSKYGNVTRMSWPSSNTSLSKSSNKHSAKVSSKINWAIFPASSLVMLIALFRHGAYLRVIFIQIRSCQR